MSWLSKLVGGNTLKLATAVIGTKFASEYIWGDYLPAGKTIESAYYSGDNFAAKTFKALGVTPFAETSVGSFLSPVTEFFRPGEIGGDLMKLAGSRLPSQQRYQQMPSPGAVQPSYVRSDLGFQAGQASYIPIGRGSSIQNALSSSEMRQYFAKQVKMMGLPPATSLPAVNISIGSPGPTTQSRRRSYSQITS